MESLYSLKNVDFFPVLIKLDRLAPLPDLNLFY